MCRLRINAIQIWLAFFVSCPDANNSAISRRGGGPQSGQHIHRQVRSSLPILHFVISLKMIMFA